MVKRILVCDDDPGLSEIVSSFLGSEGYDVQLSADGRDAIQRIGTFEPDVLITDIQMPGMDGFEVAELMRQRKDTQTIPIIFVTAISKEKKYVFKGYQAGAVDYLFKPLDPLILKSKVNFFLELDRQRRELQVKLKEAQAHRAAYEAEKRNRGQGE